MILETERLFLRKMTMEDFDSLYVEYPDEANEITHVSVIYREDI